MYAPVRGGNRGGWDQFKWDDVRLMSYKDREQYLGASDKLGYLDKGGKWRKRDWWITNKEDAANNEQLRRELEMIRREEQALMRQKLGLEPHKETKQLLQELQNDDDGQDKMLNKLTEYEMKELISKNGVLSHQNQGFENGAAADGLTDEREMADRVGGIGFQQRITLNKKLIELQKDPKSLKDDKEINQLDGVGTEDIKYLDQRKKLVMINYLKEKLEQHKLDKKEQKRLKKEMKKQKKEAKKLKKEQKKNKRHDSRSSSRSSDSNDIRDKKNKQQRDERNSRKRSRSRDNQRIDMEIREKQRDEKQHHKEENKKKYEDQRKYNDRRRYSEDKNSKKQDNYRDRSKEMHAERKNKNAVDERQSRKRQRSDSMSSNQSSSSFLSD